MRLSIVRISVVVVADSNCLWEADDAAETELKLCSNDVDSAAIAMRSHKLPAETVATVATAVDESTLNAHDWTNLLLLLLLLLLLKVKN